MANLSHLHFTPATPADRATGLLGWLSFEFEGLLIDGVALRRSRRGPLVFAWPARKDKAGRLHHQVRPLDEAFREELEGELLARLFPLIQGGAA